MNSEQDDTSGDAPREATSRAAAMLRSARMAQGLSLADVAGRTRIPLRQLEVIEAGDFAALPSRTYALGFARSYARALALDETEVTAAVREELSDAGEVRPPATRAMEPGDPAKLPSKGLAWAGAAAAALLALGLFAWFGSRFGAGEGAPPLVIEAPEETAEQAADAPAAPASAAEQGGQVVFTAMEDDVWVRLFEQGGARLLEKTLTKGESFTVPADAIDPRLNTARPDALSVTIDGKPAPRLSERARVMGSEPVSAAALRARSGATGAAPAVLTNEPAAPSAEPRPVTRRTPVASPLAEPIAPAPAPTAAPAPAPAPSPASAPAPADAGDD